jgi:PAB1-binding protein PBP1
VSTSISPYARADTSVDFRTDADISNAAPIVERELQPWVPDGPVNPPASASGSRNGSSSQSRDFETFGALKPGQPWDQFEENEKLTGIKSTYKEELYTTKLDRQAPDYKKRAKEADRLAAEITSVSLMFVKTTPVDVAEIFEKRPCCRGERSSR